MREHLPNAENPEPAKARSPESARREVLGKRILIPTSAALGRRGQTRAVQSQHSRGRGGGQMGTGKGQRRNLQASRGLRHRVQKAPTAPLTLQEAGAPWPSGPGERSRKDLSFTLTCLQASSSRKTKKEEEKGRGGLLTSVGSHGQHLGDRQ